MKVNVMTVGMFQSNCYIAYCDEKHQAIVIDPGEEGERILSFLEDNNLKAKAIVNTHAHIDHVSALAVVAGSLNVPVLLHEEDVFIYENLSYQGSLFGLQAPESVKIDGFLKDGDEISFGNCRCWVIHAPGHSPGSIALVARQENPQLIFSGDTLFRGSIGRTDVYGGNYDQMIDTLRSVFLPLPDETVVYPGHGDSTTIGDEKRYNPFMIQI